MDDVPVKKEKEKKKRKDKEKRKEKRNTQDAPQQAAEAREEAVASPPVAAPEIEVEPNNGYQLDEGFRLVDDGAACSLDLAGPGKELCLLQLPLTWEGGSGTIQLPASGAELGSCRDASGAEYHVLEAGGDASQVFAVGPGMRGPPLPISRRFTLISADKLPQPLSAEPEGQAPAEAVRPLSKAERKAQAKGQQSDGGPGSPHGSGKPAEKEKRRKQKRKEREAAAAAAAGQGAAAQEADASLEQSGRKKKKKKEKHA